MSCRPRSFIVSGLDFDDAYCTFVRIKRCEWLGTISYKQIRGEGSVYLLKKCIAIKFRTNFPSVDCCLKVKILFPNKEVSRTHVRNNIMLTSILNAFPVHWALLVRLSVSGASCSVIDVLRPYCIWFFQRLSRRASVPRDKRVYSYDFP